MEGVFPWLVAVAILLNLSRQAFPMPERAAKVLDWAATALLLAALAMMIFVGFG